MNVPIAIAIIDLALVIVLLVRRLDVRLVLLAAAVPPFAVSGGLAPMLARVVAEMANPGTVVPICTALGFAYVLRVTECDQHLIRLLLRPLDRLRWLLVPGGVLAGYLVNTTVVSQTGTAAVLGPILIPLLRAGGIPPATAGAILLLGSSMGGESFNPGAVEMVKLAQLTGISGPEVVARSMPRTCWPAEPLCSASGCSPGGAASAAVARMPRRRTAPPRLRTNRPAARRRWRSIPSRRWCRWCRWSCSLPTPGWEAFPR